MQPVIAVAAGVLCNADGEVLIAQRPTGKIAAGLWEFPGGKIEPGETAYQALIRELQEELGVRVLQARPLIRVTHEYTDRTVVLDTWRVDAFDGAPHGREQQAFAWVQPQRLTDYPLLAADHPIVTALCLPSDYVFTRADASEREILTSMAALPRGALLRLRLPSWPKARYQSLAREVIASAKTFGLRIMLDRDVAMAEDLGAEGWHASAQALAACGPRPTDSAGLWIASAHGLADLQQARRKRFDASVLGSVCATATHPGARAMGWASFAEHVMAASLPIYAIGGVSPADHERAFSCYAQGVAGISAYWSVSSS